MKEKARLIVLCPLLVCEVSGVSLASSQVCDPSPLSGGVERRAGANERRPVFIEISAGSQEKWEYSYAERAVRPEIVNGAARVINYLGYPANYGFIPNTLLALEDGGDGDPIDVVLLGKPVDRGQLVSADIVGALDYLDAGELDAKLIAVQAEGPFSDVLDLSELETKYPGAMTIISTWFENYKLDSSGIVRGYLDRDSAEELVRLAERAYALATVNCKASKP